MEDKANHVLSIGDSGEDVAAVQRDLADAGFDPGLPDGRFGTRTQQALRQFQRDHGLPGDGDVGPETAQALQNLADRARSSQSTSVRPATVSGGATMPTPTVAASGTTGAGADEPPQTEPRPSDQLTVTPSVRGLLKQTTAVTAFELARQLWSGHKTSYPDAERALAALAAAEESTRVELAVQRPADWIAAVQDQIDPARVAALEPDARVLHGQLVLYGLGRVDRSLGGLYKREGLDRALRASITPDPEDLFRLTPPASADAKLIADSPATNDLLDREGFASILARLLRQQRSHQEFGTGSIPVQIFGPWGSGKTSLAGFLRRALEQPANSTQQGEVSRGTDQALAAGPWLFVTFDAWQHQRTAPPWWWLMDRVYREARRRPGETEGCQTLPPSQRRAVWWWRWRWAVWASLTVTALAVVLTLIGSRLLEWIDSAQAVLAGLLALGGAIGTLYGTYLAARSSLLVGSPRTAVALMRSGGDPFRRVRDKYADLIERVGRPVLVFIDNLDRCRPEYVVDLLEGIQTIFGDVRVTYLVAADREWVAHSFETQYNSFSEVIGRPGRPLGYLFLEKTFAVSAPLPQPSAETRRRYWQAVLRGDTRRGTVEPVTADVRRQAVEEFNTKSLDEVIGAVENLGASSATDRARREAAAVRIVDTTMAGEQDHELRPYLPLMEANPRSLKRLRNAVSLTRAGDLASGGSIARGDDLDGLIRWTILTLRWPTLAVTLAKRPSVAELLAQQKDVADELGDTLAPLGRDDALIKLLTLPVDGGSPPDVPGWIRRHLADHDQLLPTDQNAEAWTAMRFQPAGP